MVVECSWWVYRPMPVSAWAKGSAKRTYRLKDAKERCPLAFNEGGGSCAAEVFN